MKKQSLLLLMIIPLLAVYDFLFWNETIGVNFPIFLVLLLSAFFYVFPQFTKSWAANLTTVFSIIAVTLVVITNTGLSKITAFILAGTMVAFIQQVSLRSLPYAVSYTALNFFRIPSKVLNELSGLLRLSPSVSRIFRHHKLIYFPAIITIVFLVIYSIGDPQFASVLNSLATNFFDWLNWLEQYFTVMHFVFLMLGVLIIITAIIPTRATALVENELKQRDDLKREKKKFIKPRPDSTFNYASAFTRARKLMTSLRNEYRKGVLTLVMINLLLLCVNAVDIVKVWVEGQGNALLTTDWKSVSSMRSSAVHEGTDALIFSIFLAMAVLLFFFRGNINFLSRNQLIRRLAYIWILQNTLLVFTVAIRNYYYISDCGLTMKRIGVYAFLLATLFGLLTFYVKIMQKKSSFYLVRVNCWAVCLIFMLLSCIDWDPLMAQYNITHIPREKLDKQFLLWLSDHALPVLIRHSDIFINNQVPQEIADRKKWILTNRVRRFEDCYESHSWQSWNYADFKVYHFLKTQNQFQ